MDSILTRSVTNQRGVSLMLLILAITVFAGVAIEVVMLLRTRHESYPYQVQSYQAYALAHAGVEFALRYAKENADDFFANPGPYIPSSGSAGKEFSYGNGRFALRYKPGCPDSLFSKGTCGTATREVALKNFSLYFGQNTNTLYIMGSTIQKNCYGPISLGCPLNDPPSPYPYSGDRIEFGFCDPSLLHTGAVMSMVVKDSITIAATKDGLNHPVKLLRLGFRGRDEFLVAAYNWVWDAACGTGVLLGGQYKDHPATLPAWDPIANPIPLPTDSFHLPDSAWNVNKILPANSDPTCRPRSASDPGTDPNYPWISISPPDPYPSFDNNRDCTVWGAPVARSHATCYATASMVEPWALPLRSPPLTPSAIGDAPLWPGTQLRFAIETSGSIVPPVTFYVSFLHRPWPNVPGTEKLNEFKFTVR